MGAGTLWSVPLCELASVSAAWCPGPGHSGGSLQPTLPGACSPGDSDVLWAPLAAPSQSPAAVTARVVTVTVQVRKARGLLRRSLLKAGVRRGPWSAPLQSPARTPVHPVTARRNSSHFTASVREEGLYVTCLPGRGLHSGAGRAGVGMQGLAATLGAPASSSLLIARLTAPALGSLRRRWRPGVSHFPTEWPCTLSSGPPHLGSPLLRPGPPPAGEARRPGRARRAGPEKPPPAAFLRT